MRLNIHGLAAPRGGTNTTMAVTRTPTARHAQGVRGMAGGMMSERDVNSNIDTKHVLIKINGTSREKGIMIYLSVYLPIPLSIYIYVRANIHMLNLRSGVYINRCKLDICSVPISGQHQHFVQTVILLFCF